MRGPTPHGLGRVFSDTPARGPKRPRTTVSPRADRVVDARYRTRVTGLGLRGDEVPANESSTTRQSAAERTVSDEHSRTVRGVVARIADRQFGRAAAA